MLCMFIVIALDELEVYMYVHVVEAFHMSIIDDGFSVLPSLQLSVLPSLRPPFEKVQDSLNWESDFSSKQSNLASCYCIFLRAFNSIFHGASDSSAPHLDVTKCL